MPKRKARYLHQAIDNIDGVTSKESSAQRNCLNRKGYRSDLINRVEHVLLRASGTAESRSADNMQCVETKFLRSQTSDPVTTFRKEALKAHNYYRDIHESSQLRLSEKLNEYAQEWADEIAHKGKKLHRKQDKFGECLVWMWNSQGSESFTGRVAVDEAYANVTKYDFKTNTTTADSGKNFTQMIWSTSVELGVGVAINPNDPSDMYAVFNYFPAGNIPGDYKANVKPPRRKKK
ncbi:Golgi-associated plant pathogenesis-related protein 1-like [Glandiceps talaboti]